MRDTWLFPLHTLALLDDLVFAMIGGGNTVGEADLRGVGGIGVGSTLSSSSRSVADYYILEYLENDDIVRGEKSTAVGLLLVWGIASALDVMGPTGSSSVPPPLPLWPLSEAARRERWSGPMTTPSPESK